MLMIVILVVGGSLGIFGVYLGLKLSGFRPHRKSREVQIISGRSDLD